jgi:hypothetical protein
MVIPRISEDMSSEPPSARWLVRELISRAAARSKTPHDLDEVALEACENTYRDLARELGAASAQALVNRAQAQAALTYPSLSELRLYREREARTPNGSTATKSDGAVTAKQLESLLEALLVLLGRFVGINIVVRLLSPRDANDQTLNEGRR